MCILPSALGMVVISFERYLLLAYEAFHLMERFNFGSLSYLSCLFSCRYNEQEIVFNLLSV